jgi:membrane protein DedA with SNARE-associated domain
MSSVITSVVHNFGALGVALGAGLEGETAAVLGGALARNGAFHPAVAAAAAMLGSLVADQLFFFLGRSQRRSKIVARIAGKPAFGRALRMIERHPIGFCLAFRFVYGFRIAGPVAIGVSQVATSRFVALNALSAAVWAVIFTAVGWRFGRAFERLLRAVLTPAHFAIAFSGVCLVVLLVLIVRRKARPTVAGSMGPNGRGEDPHG